MYQYQSKFHKKVGLNESFTTDWVKAIFYISSCIHKSTYEFFIKQGFDPGLTPYTCRSVSSPMGLGSDSLPVSITLFDQKIFLADSIQFYLEYLLRFAPKGVFYIMPSIRGEEPDTRHLNEFFHIEAELHGNFDKCLNLIQDFLKEVISAVLVCCEDKIHNLGIMTNHLHDFLNLEHIASIKFDKALEILGEDHQYYRFIESTPIALTQLGEEKLIDLYGPIWLTYLPTLGVPFYQEEVDHDKTLTADLLLGFGEIIGCGQRKTNAQTLLNDLVRRGIDTAPYQWYYTMKKNYPVQSSGFGLGLERLIMWILQHEDIRDIPLFDRLKNSIYEF